MQNIRKCLCSVYARQRMSRRDRALWEHDAYNNGDIHSDDVYAATHCYPFVCTNSRSHRSTDHIPVKRTDRSSVRSTFILSDRWSHC